MANYSSTFRVFQDWGNAATGTAGEQNVFVFGPQYALNRYTDEEEKAGMASVPFSGTGGDKLFEKAFEVYADYQLSSLEVFVENAFVKISDLDASEMYVQGDYNDGVFVVKGEITGVDEGDYFYFVDSDGNADKIRIAAKPTPKEDAEYESVVWTEFHLALGLPDSFSDGVPEGFTLCFAKAIDSLKVSADAVTVSGEDVTVSLDTATDSGVLLEGNAFFSTKQLYIGSSGKIGVLVSTTDVIRELGQPDPENPVSMGAYNALAGGASVVYYYITDGETPAAFEKALDLATLDKNLYYMVPMTQNQEILRRVATYCDTQSDEDHKRWRIAVVCSDVGYVVTKDGYKVIKNGTYGASVKFVTLGFENDAPDVTDGDIIDVDGVQFIAVKTLNRTTVLTHTRDDELDTPATGPATVTHTRNSNEYAKAVGSAAEGYGTHRIVDVFPKKYKLSGNEYSGMYLAPVIAGLASSVDPQAPISNMTVPAVDDIPEIYSKLSFADLDTIASGGVLIVTQDMEGERCYVRKQLTAGTSTGVLAKTELSMVKNYDNIAYTFNEVIEGYKGNYNVTDELIKMIRVALEETVYAMQQRKTSDLIGPQLLEGSSVDRVERDATNRAKINAWVHCDLPVPFNDMDLFLSVVTTYESSGIG